jgi:hypothetical protein
VLSAITDASGVYILPNVPVGTHPVTVLHAGQLLLAKNTIVVAGRTESDIDIPTRIEGTLALTGRNSLTNGQFALGFILLGLLFVMVAKVPSGRRRRPICVTGPSRCHWTK